MLRFGVEISNNRRSRSAQNITQFGGASASRPCEGVQDKRIFRRDWKMKLSRPLNWRDLVRLLSAWEIALSSTNPAHVLQLKGQPQARRPANLPLRRFTSGPKWRRRSPSSRKCRRWLDGPRRRIRAADRFNRAAPLGLNVYCHADHEHGHEHVEDQLQSEGAIHDGLVAMRSCPCMVTKVSFASERACIPSVGHRGGHA